MGEHRETLLEVIDAQLAQLSGLREDEERLAALRAREAELEVENLLGDAAVKSGLKKGQPAIAVDDAVAIMGLRRRLQPLQAELPPEMARAGTGETTERVHLRVAVAALTEWLEAPRVKDSGRTQFIARVVVLVLTIISVWAAIAVHPAFLLMIFPVVAPLTLLFRAGENTSWRRLGAKRKFEQTGLAGPSEWSKAAVAQRHCELAEISLRAESRRSDPGHDPNTEDTGEAEPIVRADDADLAAQVDALEQELALRLSAIGEDALSDPLESWLEILRKAGHARRDLTHVRTSRESLAARSSAAREGIFRFLSRHGATPPEGSADPDALVTGLEHVRREATGE